MVGEIETVNGVDVDATPQLKEFLILVDSLYDLPEYLVLASRNPENHLCTPLTPILPKQHARLIGPISSASFGDEETACLYYYNT